MGYSKVRRGDHVIGSGKSPSTGKNINGKHGDVTDAYNHMDGDIVEVKWKSGDSDTVRQDNVSGTGQCNGRRGCQG
jgi:hypothetical protein